MGILIISGPPASGKTTIGKKLAEGLKLPFFSKDAFKEVLFDTIGDNKTPETAKALGRASFQLMFHALERELEAGRSCTIEANFRHSFDREKLLSLRDTYAAKCFEVFCSAPDEILIERFARRADSPERHAGHADAFDVGTLKKNLEEKVYVPLELGEVIRLDTSDFAGIDVLDVSRRIRDSLSII